jgi:hypothetical protein
VRIEAKPLQLADIDNNDDDPPTYLEAETQHTVGIPRAGGGRHSAYCWYSTSCRRRRRHHHYFEAPLQQESRKKGTGVTERVQNELEKKEREEAAVEEKYKAEEAAD